MRYQLSIDRLPLLLACTEHESGHPLRKAVFAMPLPVPCFCCVLASLQTRPTPRMPEDDLDDGVSRRIWPEHGFQTKSNCAHHRGWYGITDLGSYLGRIPLENVIIGKRLKPSGLS